jgi:antitoxin ParD1/3/4
MGFQLRRETEEQIEQRIKSGKYASADDVVLAGLALLEAREHSKQRDLDQVREKIAEGLAQLDRGEGADGDAVFRELLSELEVGDVE